MWGVIAAWVVCLASLSLPWPGIIIVALLCCLAFFELAGPTKWVKKDGRNERAAGEVADKSWGVAWAPVVAVTRAFQDSVDALHRWRGRKVVEENGSGPGRAPVAKSTAQTVSSITRDKGIEYFDSSCFPLTINSDLTILRHAPALFITWKYVSKDYPQPQGGQCGSCFTSSLAFLEHRVYFSSTVFLAHLTTIPLPHITSIDVSS